MGELISITFLRSWISPINIQSQVILQFQAYSTSKSLVLDATPSPNISVAWNRRYEGERGLRQSSTYGSALRRLKLVTFIALMTATRSKHEPRSSIENEDRHQWTCFITALAAPIPTRFVGCIVSFSERETSDVLRTGRGRP